MLMRLILNKKQKNMDVGLRRRIYYVIYICHYVIYFLHLNYYRIKKRGIKCNF